MYVCVWVVAGSTGAPKGVVHSTAGYLLYAAMTHKYVFDYREGDVYACVADIGYVVPVRIPATLRDGPLAHLSVSYVTNCSLRLRCLQYMGGGI